MDWGLRAHDFALGFIQFGVASWVMLYRVYLVHEPRLWFWKSDPIFGQESCSYSLCAGVFYATVTGVCGVLLGFDSFHHTLHQVSEYLEVVFSTTGNIPKKKLDAEAEEELEAIES